MRKLFAFLAVIGLVVGLAACGSDDKDSGGSGGGELLVRTDVQQDGRRQVRPR